MTEQLLTAEQRQQIEGLVADETSEVWRRCARILLLYDDGHPTREVAPAVGLSPGGVRYWRRKFWNQGITMFPGISQPTEDIPEKEESEAIAIPPELQVTIDLDRGEESIPTPPVLEPEIVQPEDQAEISGIDVPELPSLAEFISSAKTLKKPGVLPEDHFAEAGRKVLRYHFAQMLLHEDGTRLGEDIEELHDMRVATRRMRAAVEVFGDAFEPKALKVHLKGLKATGRALGCVRDLDVFMEKAQKYLETQPEEHRQGLKPLLDSWEAEREAARAKMIAYLDGERYQSFKSKFYTFLTTAGAGARQLSPDQPTPHLVREIAPVLIYTRMAVVRAFNAVLENASIEQLHALRIEFKKLRYTAEFFREVLGKEAKAVINGIKDLQDHLGDLNDAQVATEILRDFLAQWDLQQAVIPVTQRESPEPIMAYLSSRYYERHRLMLTFRQSWEHFNHPEFRENLAMSISVL